MPEQRFNEKKFESLLKQNNLSPDEVKFTLKVLVWRQTNWQTETFLDLNLSFFGGQFRDLINGGDLKEQTSPKVLACGQEAFLRLSEKSFYSKRQVLICGLSEFESAITANIAAKVSWGYINYLAKSIYNPESAGGAEKFKESVERALAASDLFFGLASALLQTDPPSFQYYKISTETEYDEKYQKIKSASENYAVKLSSINEILQSESIARFIKDLQGFFTPQDNRVKWIELAENRCALLSMPLDISGLVKNLLKPFGHLSFADFLGQQVLPSFFMSRLGLNDFVLESSGEQKKDSKKPFLKQGDLFSGTKKLSAEKIGKIKCYCLPAAAQPEELLKLVKPSELSAAVLFGGQLQVKDFYEQNYQKLKESAFLMAQHSSGGSNKIFRNFDIHSNSLLLATDKFILKHLIAQNLVEPVVRLGAKTLILCRLPFEQFTHPYQEALGQTLANAFEDYALPRALYNFHQIIKFFYTPRLKNIYIIDAKLAKPYAKVFKEYLKTLPGAEMQD